MTGLNIGHFSYVGGAFAYVMLSGMVWARCRQKPHATLFALATASTAVWASILAVQAAVRIIPSAVVWSAEVIHVGVWLIFVHRRISVALEYGSLQIDYLKYIPLLVYSLSAGLLAYTWLASFLGSAYPAWFPVELPIIGQLLLSVLGLVLVELFYRNTRPELRWHIKFLCFAVGGIFAYDLYLYSDTLLFKRISPDLWAARGAVIALLTPLLALSVIRDTDWSLGLLVSRSVIFHSVTLLGSGVYLVLMSAAGFYIRSFGGEWGAFWQVVFLVGAFLILMLVLVSGQIRANIRVFLSKHFFSYSYDYRREWLGTLATLSEQDSSVPLEQRAIQSLAQLVESPGGLLWVQDETGSLVWRDSFGGAVGDVSVIPASDILIEFVEKQGWVVNLDELSQVPELYSGLSVPEWLSACPNAWLLVPLFLGDRLYGLVLLTQPRAEIDWNWEVIDLLKTAGRQTAGYLALEDTANKLSEARQFEGFNRLSAFVIHDLKNLIAQLTLVVRNAERHSANPEFMRDAIQTVDHAVGKMSRLMSQLKNAGAVGANELINIDQLLSAVVAERAGQLPVPDYQSSILAVEVYAHRDRLASAFEHVIQNAQDAAGRGGEVAIRLHSGENQAIVEVDDNGGGMTQEFIRERLFKPFETTKGLTGMGIGAYESREYIRALGGNIQVKSEPDKGTLFKFTIPLERQEMKETDMDNKSGT